MLALSRVVIHAFDLEYPDKVVVLQRFFPAIHTRNIKDEI